VERSGGDFRNVPNFIATNRPRHDRKETIRFPGEPALHPGI
jgi:hypothetical protein